jgi:RNA polymerase sigma-70 factor (ECF subfamily)
MSLPDDIELAGRLQKGDVNAFDLIYRKYSGKLYAFGLKLLKSEVEAEELVQGVFLKLWENHKTLNPGLSFKSYLFTITYNDICKLFRRRHYIRKFIDETVYENLNTAPDLAESIDYKSLLERVELLISKLPERQKSIFMKSRDEGKSTREIASELGLSPGTIDNYISQSLKFIRSHLLNEDFALLILLSTSLF